MKDIQHSKMCFYKILRLQTANLKTRAGIRILKEKSFLLLTCKVSQVWNLISRNYVG